MHKSLSERLGSCSSRGMLSGSYVEDVHFSNENLYIKTESQFIRPDVETLPLVLLAEDLMMSINDAKLVKGKQLRCVVEQNGMVCSIYLDKGNQFIKRDSLIYLMQDYLALLLIHPYDKMVGKYDAKTILDVYAKDLIRFFRP